MTFLNTVSAYIKEHTDEMFRLLEEMVLLQSSSHNKPGVDRVAALIAATFRSDSVTCETVKQDIYGNHLLVRTGPTENRNRQVLLVGHMDTVFPEDTDFNWYKEDRANSYGPGVADMKGGLVAGIFAMKALIACGLIENIPITFIFNSDEEIGSGSSREIIRQEARNSAFAFVLECGGLNQEIVTGRKGNLSIKLTVRGRAGHAAFAGPDKASAVLELARKTIEFESLNDPKKGISANVGIVTGGIGANTVAENAVARIDFRFPTDEACGFLKKKIKAIALNCSVPHTESIYEILSTRPPMPVCVENKNLFNTISETAAKLGTKVTDQYRQGVSDANLIAAGKVPVVDGLGPAGARDHSRKEYIIKETLPQRSILIACSIVDCWKKCQERVP